MSLAVVGAAVAVGTAVVGVSTGMNASYNAKKQAEAQNKLSKEAMDRAQSKSAEAEEKAKIATDLQKNLITDTERAGSEIRDKVNFDGKIIRDKANQVGEDIRSASLENIQRKEALYDKATKQMESRVESYQTRAEQYKQNTVEALDQRSDWAETFGPVQENIAEFYKDLSPESITASGLDMHKGEHDKRVSTLRKTASQRGIGGASLLQLEAEEDQAYSEMKAKTRLMAPVEAMQMKADFIASNPGMNPYDDKVTALRSQEGNAIGEIGDSLTGVANSFTGKANSHDGMAQTIQSTGQLELNAEAGTRANELNALTSTRQRELDSKQGVIQSTQFEANTKNASAGIQMGIATQHAESSRQASRDQAHADAAVTAGIASIASSAVKGYSAYKDSNPPPPEPEGSPNTSKSKNS